MLRLLTHWSITRKSILLTRLGKGAKKGIPCFEIGAPHLFEDAESSPFCSINLKLIHERS